MAQKTFQKIGIGLMVYALITVITWELPEDARHGLFGYANVFLWAMFHVCAAITSFCLTVYVYVVSRKDKSYKNALAVNVGASTLFLVSSFFTFGLVSWSFIPYWMDELIFDYAPISIFILVGLGALVLALPIKRIAKVIVVALFAMPIMMYGYQTLYHSLPVDIDAIALQGEVKEQGENLIYYGNFVVTVEGIQGKGFFSVISENEIERERIRKTDVIGSSYYDLIKNYEERQGSFFVSKRSPDVVKVNDEIQQHSSWIHGTYGPGQYNIQVGYILDANERTFVEEGKFPSLCLERVLIRGNELLENPVCSRDIRSAEVEIFASEQCDKFATEGDMKAARACVDLLAQPVFTGNIIEGCNHLENTNLRDYCYTFNLQNPILDMKTACEKIEDAYLRERCYALGIVESKADISACESIVDDHVKSECKKLVNANIDLCENKKPEEKYPCISKLAYKHSSTLICEKISHRDWRNLCIRWHVHNTQECSLIEHSGRNRNNCGLSPTDDVLK